MTVWICGSGASPDFMVRPDDLYTQVRLIDDVGFARAESVGVLVDCDDARAIVEFADRDVDEAILVTGPEDLERVDDDTTVAASAT
ncbi:MAG: hypothetical protein NT143_02915 [Actinobacteria bacterium]|nr:hypothetical protein [Actinomycetota bacterium]